MPQKRNPDAAELVRAGVGFSGQGKFEGTYYRRLPASYAPVDAVFQRIGDPHRGVRQPARDSTICGADCAIAGQFGRGNDAKIWRYAPVRPNSVEISTLGLAPRDARFRRFFRGVFQRCLATYEPCDIGRMPAEASKLRNETFLGLERSN